MQAEGDEHDDHVGREEVDWVEQDGQHGARMQTGGTVGLEGASGYMCAACSAQRVA